MPPRKAAARKSRPASANGSDQEAKKPVNKRASRVEIEKKVDELPPKKKAKTHHHGKQGEYTRPNPAFWEVYYLACLCASTVYR